VTTLDATSARPWCLFKSDSRPFAVGLDAVAEVVEADRLVRLSLCPPQVLGLCTVRRDIVPVLSLTPPAAGGEREPEGKTIVLILRSDEGVWGIRADREGTAVADGRFEPAGSLADDAEGAAIVGTLKRGDHAHAVIDPGQTWRNVREHVEAWYRR
jgi:chemotaxis signal transduction protein